MGEVRNRNAKSIHRFPAARRCRFGRRHREQNKEKKIHEYGKTMHYFWRSGLFIKIFKIVMRHDVAPIPCSLFSTNNFLQMKPCWIIANRYNVKTKSSFMLMRSYLKRSVPVELLALLCLSSGLVMAEETSDPFSTGAIMPHKPALHQIGAVGDPCADIRTDYALDLLSVVNIALCNNPQTREVWANSRAQAAQVGVARASYLPSASATLSGNRSTPGNSQRSASLNLSYLLYDFGARAANLENARQTLVSVSATQDSVVQTLFLTSEQAYYQTRATLAAYEAAIVSERAAQASFAAANARYLAGSATPADKLAAQTAYSQATLNRITASGAMKIAQGNLANILALDANVSVTLVATSPLPNPLPHAGEGANVLSPEGGMLKDFDNGIAALIEEARRNRPDLQAAQALVLAAQATAEAARAAGKPVISLTGAANQSNSAGISTHVSTLGLSMSIPIFSGFAPTYRIRAAEAQIDARKAQLERLRLQVALDVWIAYQNLVTATQNRRTTADLLESAEQSERVALGRYKAGMGIMLDVLNAQTTLASARQQRIQAALNWNISRATLAQAMGSLDASLLQTLSDSGNQQSGENPPTEKSSHE